MKRPLQIFITNDDSIAAKGLSMLIELAQDFGRLTVVAPQVPQSGKSCSVSVGKILRLIPLSDGFSLRQFTCNGTPVDCVKIAMSELFAEERPDLVLSGINHGSNSSASVLYSGTLGAAAEATRYGVPAIGFSLCSHDRDANFDTVLHFGRIFLESYFRQPPLPADIYLNVNIPDIPKEKIRGFRFCHLGKGHWTHEFEIRTDPTGNPYYWLTGQYVNAEPQGPTDQNFLEQNYISVTPITTDYTHYQTLAQLQSCWKLP